MRRRMMIDGWPPSTARQQRLDSDHIDRVGSSDPPAHTPQSPEICCFFSCSAFCDRKSRFIPYLIGISQDGR